ncbi:hypothetical protein RSW97_26745, partial [Escherichia coli]|nr:hypothetical protein [Escherichia coli]
GVKVGDVVEINGRQVKVVGSTHGLRGLGGVNVITSLANARRLDPNAGPGDDVAYFVAQVDDPRRAAAVADELNAVGKRRGFE